MIESPHTTDPLTGVPVFSLYSETRRPLPAMLDGLDCLIVDLQDVGTRVYTFVWTMLNCLEACKQAGLSVVVLDRPNPLGGDRFEGPRIEAGYESFVGLARLPMRHGLTIGELALYLNDVHAIGTDLHVVRMAGYRSAMTWQDTGRSWIPTSPNLPRIEGVFVYPGQVLLEGTNLSEGRGTTTPFEICGAGFIDPLLLARMLDSCSLPGVVLRPLRFEPTFQKWARQSCGGLFLHPAKPGRFEPYFTTLCLLWAVRRLWPNQFRWTNPPYEYETERVPIDILTGSSRLRAALDAGENLTIDDLRDLAACDSSWPAEIRPYRLYEP